MRRPAEEVAAALDAAEEGLPATGRRRRLASAPRSCAAPPTSTRSTSPSSSRSPRARPARPADGIAEVREAVDFLRYYANEAERLEAEEPGSARGVFVCISPWNFPLAIFTGQIAAALAAGNAVLAKPAEQTPLIAARAVELMREAGVPEAASAAPARRRADVGGPLTAIPGIAGVCFTGSTEVARSSTGSWPQNAGPDAVLIAETGGLNAMIVDSTALPEQAVRDILISSFQSAGQRCSALRVLYVQEEARDRLLDMLDGAMDALSIGDPWNTDTDVGPVIDAEAQRDIDAYVKAQRRGRQGAQDLPTPRMGTFVAPAVVEVEGHRGSRARGLRPGAARGHLQGAGHRQGGRRDQRRGYGLTFGLHTRIDDRVQQIVERLHVGNIYVNRNQIGAIVGSQPFGGEGLSGTGPKAGGPLYARFTRTVRPAVRPRATAVDAGAGAAVAAAPIVDPQLFADAFERAREVWDARSDRAAILHAAAGRLPAALSDAAAQALQAAAPFFAAADALPGPTGESNHLTLHGRGIALCLGDGGEDAAMLTAQAFVALAAGNAVALPATPAGMVILDALRTGGIERALASVVQAADPVALVAAFPESVSELGLVAFDGEPALAAALRGALAARAGRRVLLLSLADGVMLFSAERVVSIDTTASGGNATLLTLSEA
jgi:RHH-type transcriptional regulator, proline utilization regulon repressor / proline dehydrogenase / delta 1-pyrroline-5-carboxylate dehydrogenase